MALNEPEGMKDHIKIKPVLLEPIREESYANLPKGFRKVIKFKPVGGYVTIVNVNDISTPYDLAFFIRHHHNYGFGLWAVTFYDRYKRNRHFKNYFECIGMSCKYWDGCKVKKRKLANPKKYKKCKMNLTHRPNWSSRAWVDITAKADASGDNDFNFKFAKSRDQMHKFWFWNNSQNLKKIPKEDMFY